MGEGQTSEMGFMSHDMGRCWCCETRCGYWFSGHSGIFTRRKEIAFSKKFHQGQFIILKLPVIVPDLFGHKFPASLEKFRVTFKIQVGSSLRDAVPCQISL